MEIRHQDQTYVPNAEGFLGTYMTLLSTINIDFVMISCEIKMLY